MDFYNTKRWKTISESVKRRDEYMCQICKRYGRKREATHVHHIMPLEFYPEYRTAGWNLISLCRECHNRMHDRDTHELTGLGNKLARTVAREQGLPWER
ncbi:MAG: HNH endonuclease [Clostridiales bacterium]|nr:HNH endonuclease [Clostridiales bacterium]